MYARYGIMSDRVARAYGVRLLVFSLAVAAGIVFTCVLGCQPPYQQKPIPSGQNGATWEEVNKRQGQWLTETELAAYEKYGQRSEEWDSQVREYIAGLSETLMRANDEEWLLGRHELGKELMVAGCTDPLVLYIYGSDLHGLNRPEEAWPVVLKSLELFEASQYPARFRFHAARRLTWMKSTVRLSPRMFLSRDKMKYMAQAANDPDYANGNQRLYIQEFFMEWGDDSSLPVEAQIFMQEFDKLANVDPWIEQMVRGRYHIGLGWKARGSGFVDTVSEEGWDTFHAELKIAEEHFAQAYALHPEFPEAAASMITVSMAMSGDVSPREWFDRSVAAQFDYRPAYVKLLWSMRPRWGGSHAEMYRFGVECMDTKRFDTEIPRFFLQVVWDTGTELDDWRDAYRPPETYALLQTFFESTLAEPSRAENQDYFKSAYGVVAWAAGEYEDASRLFDELGEKIDPSAFVSFDPEMDFVVSDAFYRGGPLKAAYLKAEKLSANGQAAAALPLLEELCEKSPDDLRMSWVPRDRIATLRFQQQFLAGDWVDLLPHDEFLGWEKLKGDWSVRPDGELRGTVREQDWTIVLMNKARIQGNYEIRGETEVEYSSSVIPGIMLGYRGGDEPEFVRFVVTGYAGGAKLGKNFDRQETMESGGQFKLANPFLLQVWNSQVTAYVNDQPVFVARDVGRLGVPHNGRVGFGDDCHGNAGRVIKYRNMQIRRLVEKPKVPEEPKAEAAEE